MSTNYTKTSVSFRLRKAGRYISLYGFARTLAKVRAQYRLPETGKPLSETWVNPKVVRANGVRDVALIGCGSFAYTTIAHYCRQMDHGALSCAYDPNGSRSIALARDMGAARAVASVEEILADPQIRIVYIASNHASHAEYAIRCLAAGKSVHIEKPHVVTEDQLNRLISAMRNSPKAQVFLGFNRPRSQHFSWLQDVLRGENGAFMINWFVAGHEIPPDHWYFSETEGGRVLGNLCHWTDLTLRMIGVEQAFPCELAVGGAPGSQSDFVVSFAFADGSSAAITFSAKGHTFEGVREILNVHRGNALCSLRDFEESRADVEHRRLRLRTRHRDHGHRANILNSLLMARAGHGGESEQYVRLTAALFLAARLVTETRQVHRVLPDGVIQAQSEGVPA